ncbi:spinster family MFS transporter [Halopseudomonas aestusnigri]|uniref:Predicted arabinose efflux permease, MFS family n=1 Tax=Halopseudomonas aestusnigri TaxID=857252 RepID=A0AAQ1G5D1_9GAMM|nr:MFS transporter [Halopseudomonas aestusnigri]OWL90086.1 MFS transporter [Halopseudomonas aestusnigri]SEF81493.1 Predicted arabinose efflux permease, MFS family [Halopseudomonas aestusnigri]
MAQTPDTAADTQDVSYRITPAYRRYALFILVLAYTSSHVDRNIVGILIEPLKADLLLSDTQLGFLSGIAFALFYATLGIPIAIFADRSNRRNIIAWSIAIWSAMTAVCGLAQNFWQLAIARIGVGIGEAGSSPPSHSMIADLYPKEQRSSAMSIYALGVYLGIMIGFIVGGFVAEWWGWRAAFFVVGLPGILIALLVRFTMIEPPRGFADGVKPPPMGKVNIKAGFAVLWRVRTTRHVVLGVTLTALVGYGTIVWNPAFLIRSHGLTPGQVGLFLGPLMGVVGGLGAWIGGMLADKLAARDASWNAWIVGVAKLLAIPFIIAFYMVDSTFWALVVYCPAVFLGAFYLGPSFAMIQSLTPLRSRALASAIMLLVLNLVGLGLGPQLIGIVSDLVSGPFGSDSLRYALIGAAFVNIWACAHYYLAGRTIRQDLDTVDA